MSAAVGVGSVATATAVLANVDLGATDLGIAEVLALLARMPGWHAAPGAGRSPGGWPAQRLRGAQAVLEQLKTHPGADFSSGGRPAAPTTARTRCWLRLGDHAERCCWG